MTLRRVFLHGRLRSRFKGPFSFEASSVQEVVRALAANLPGFRAELAKGAYRIVVGAARTGERLTEDLLAFQLPPGRPVHIVPTVTGRKRSGLGKTILGIALISVAAIASGGTFGAIAGLTGGVFSSLSWGTVALFGAALTFGGIAQLLTPIPKTPSLSGYERPEDRPSFLLGGQVNTTLQGNPIPIVGGRMLVGGLVISAGIYTEKMPV
jgi:predicted phage tail protein